MLSYYATKVFVQSFSEALAEEMVGKGITVTALSWPCRCGLCGGRGFTARDREDQEVVALFNQLL